MLAVLVMVAIASAARSRPNLPAAVTVPSALVNLRTHVPTSVMSTLRRACVDCHTDETRWPWYAALPIASHLIERDVAEARGQLNLSHWTQYDRRAAARNPDGVMFYKIWNGRANPKMPAMKTDITRADVWTLIHYVKTLRKE